MTHDFKITDKNFKNYSIFNDVPRHKIVAGLRKLIAEKNNSFNNVFKKYQALIIFFTRQNEKIQKLDPTKANEYAQYIEHLEERKAQWIQTCTQLIEKYDYYLPLTPEEIQAAENLEKIFAGPENISLHSKHEKVKLNHLRIKNNHVIKFQKNDNKIVFQFDNNANALRALENLKAFYERDDIQLYENMDLYTNLE